MAEADLKSSNRLLVRKVKFFIQNTKVDAKIKSFSLTIA
jgi:hypothetical protein